MGKELTILVGMTIITVSSAIAQIVLKALCKNDEAQLMDFVTKCLLVVTVCTTFITAIKSILTLV